MTLRGTYVTLNTQGLQTKSATAIFTSAYSRYESRVLTVKRAEEHEGCHDFLFSSFHSDYFRYPRGPNDACRTTRLYYRENILEIMAGRFDTRNQQHFIKLIQKSRSILFERDINADACAIILNTLKGCFFFLKTRRTRKIINSNNLMKLCVVSKVK